MKPEETMKILLQNAALIKKVSAMRAQANAEEKIAAAFDTMQASGGSTTKANEAATLLRNQARDIYRELEAPAKWASRTADNWENYAGNARTRAAHAKELADLFSTLGEAAAESARYSKRPEDKKGWGDQSEKEIATGKAWKAAAQAWTDAGAAWDKAAASRKVAEAYDGGE